MYPNGNISDFKLKIINIYNIQSLANRVGETQSIFLCYKSLFITKSTYNYTFSINVITYFFFVKSSLLIKFNFFFKSIDKLFKSTKLYFIKSSLYYNLTCYSSIHFFNISTYLFDYIVSDSINYYLRLF